jgi:cell wall-associated NlpC family hydrolase
VFARGVLRAFLAAVALSLVATGLAAPAQASTDPPAGHLMTVRQNTFTHTLVITGWAYDPSAPRASVSVRLLVDGVAVRTVRADQPSAKADKTFGLIGSHGYALTLTGVPWARTVTAKSRGVKTTAPLRIISTHLVTHYEPSPGQRIVTVAKRYVGARYVEGGATPSGFDCSGYTMYVYEHADVHKLAHNAELQRRSMRGISRANARPGDLVFYMSGGTAYHVAIYAGHGWQYAAATPRDGVRYQRVWSSAVQYRTDWH